MNSQLTFFPETKNKSREYIRDRSGKFATKEQSEHELILHERNSYKLMYEAERRKLKPVIKRLLSVERELNELRIKIKNL